MVSRFSELCVDCADPRRLAAFWRDVLGWEISEEDLEGTPPAVELQNPEGHLPTLLFVQVPEGKQGKNRLHIDVNPRDREQAEEVERVLALGATHAEVGQTGEESWVVLADPEGNEFCILSTRQP